MFHQAALAAWAALSLLQLPLLAWVWSSAPTGREKRRSLCYSVALPCCVLPVVNWLLLMFGIIAAQDTGSFPNDLGIGMMIILLMFLTLTSVVVLPLTFLLFFGIRGDTAFWTLRCVAFVNLIASLVFGAAVSLGGFDHFPSRARTQRNSPYSVASGRSLPPLLAKRRKRIVGHRSAGRTEERSDDVPASTISGTTGGLPEQRFARSGLHYVAKSSDRIRAQRGRHRRPDRASRWTVHGWIMRRILGS